MSAGIEHAIGERAHQARFGPAVYQRVSVGANPVAQLLYRGRNAGSLPVLAPRYTVMFIFVPLLWRTTFVLALASTILAHAA